jgi:hypothetical protein
MEDATIWVDVIQNISNNGKRIFNNHGNFSNTSLDSLDKTTHGSSGRLRAHSHAQTQNTIIDGRLNIITDVSSHAKFIVNQYDKNRVQCNIFIVFVFFVSILSISVSEFYDW